MMRIVILILPALVIVAASSSSAANDPAPEPIGPPEAAPVTHSAAASPTVVGNSDTLPWNPDLRHANDWPYSQPLHIDTDYCGPPGEFWLVGECLLWWLKGDRLPPLVTTGPVGSTGVLGQPGVTTLFGDASPERNPFSGGRFTGGAWFDSSYTLGFEGSYFFLAQREVSFTAASSGQPGSAVLARPFVNAGNIQPTSVLLASPGVASGQILILAPIDLQGGEANLVWNLFRSPRLSADVAAGFRYLYLREEVKIDAETTSFATGTSTAAFDQFVARNHFYGGQLGGRVDYRWRWLVFSVSEKLALGANTSQISIAGNTAKSALGVVTSTPGGLLVQPSNIGNHSDDTFSLVNELRVQAGWQINDCVQIFAGYTFLYASSVVRPGDLVDLSVNTTQSVGGLARPAFAPRESSFWANGLNVGLEVRY